MSELGSLFNQAAAQNWPGHLRLYASVQLINIKPTVQLKPNINHTHSVPLSGYAAHEHELLAQLYTRRTDAPEDRETGHLGRGTQVASCLRQEPR